MKRLLICVTTLTSLMVQGQNENPVPKVLIGFNFSPDYSSRTLKNNDGGSSGDLIIRNRNNIEVAKFGYTTGLNVCFNISPIAALETGIQYSDKGYKTNSQDLVWIPPEPGLPTKARSVYSYQYIGIPLKARFSVGKSKVHFFSSIGIMTNFLLTVKQTRNYEYTSGKKERMSQSSASGFKKIDISPMLSAGIDYKLNSKIHLFAEPVFRYGIIKTKDAPVTENLWSTGLNFGLYYALK